jgi:Carboxypeptidase regulatory-like domain
VSYRHNIHPMPSAARFRRTLHTMKLLGLTNACVDLFEHYCKPDTGMKILKRYASCQSWLVLVLLSCAIANAQNPIPDVTVRVPDSFPIVRVSSPNAVAFPQQAQQGALHSASDSGTVIGTVVDRNGSAAAGAIVRLISGDKSFSQQTVSGDNGEFSFPNVPPGPFMLSAGAEGFGEQQFSGELTSGQTYLVPPIAITIQTVVTEVKVKVDPVKVATEEVKEQEQQRVLRFIPNFYVTYRQDAAPLTAKLKFQLAWKSSTDPVTFLGVAFLAGLEQAGDQYPEFGQGAQGYGKRFGAGYIDVFASTFLSGAVFPSFLKQDPRYYYQGTGSTRSRLVHAVANAVLCKGDNRRGQVNYSNIAGAFAGAALSSTFYPTTNPGMFTLSNGFVRLGESSLAGVVQEFLLKKLTKTKDSAKTRTGNGDPIMTRGHAQTTR